MKFNLRKFNDVAFCTLEESGTIIDFGVLDVNDAKKLLREIEDAADELKWYLEKQNKEPK